MLRKTVTIADLRAAAAPAHCLYGGVVQLSRIWSVLHDCGVDAAWGRRVTDCGMVVVQVDYSPGNLEAGLAMVKRQIEYRERRNKRARELRAHASSRRHRMFGKIDR